MAVHVATIRLVNVDATGQVIEKSRSTIQQVIASSSQEHRIIPDTDIPSTAGWPTIKAYLELEDVAGFTLRHLDQTYVVTYD